MEEVIQDRVHNMPPKRLYCGNDEHPCDIANAPILSTRALILTSNVNLRRVSLNMAFFGRRNKRLESRGLLSHKQQTSWSCRYWFRA